MKKFLALFLAMLMTLSLAAAYGSDTATTSDGKVSANLTMGTGGESGTYYAFGGVLGNVIDCISVTKINVVATAVLRQSPHAAGHVSAGHRTVRRDDLRLQRHQHL